MKEHVQQVLADATYIALTADAWTASNKKQFLGITCAFLNAEWKVETYTLACRELNIAHTAVNIADTITDVMGDFDIESSKIVAITTDRGANMLAAVNLLNKNSVPCFAHAVNTVVTKMLKHDSINESLKKIKQLHNILSASSNAQRFMHTLQAKNKLPQVKLPSACETRWWSELRQIVYIDTQQSVVTDFMNKYENGKHKSLLFEHRELRLLAAVKPLLQSLEKFEETLSTESEVTGSLILKSVRDIQLKLREPVGDIVDSGVMAFRLHLRKLASEFEDIYQTRTTSHMEMATFCDRRFERIESAAMESVARQDAKELPLNVAETPAPQTTTRTALEELFGSDTETGGDLSNQHEKPSEIDDELQRFCCEPKLKYGVDISMWWAQRKGVYPTLAEIAKKYLCISATSVPSERVFSVGGAVVTKFRQSITEEHTEELIFLAKNKKKLPFW